MLQPSYVLCSSCLVQTMFSPDRSAHRISSKENPRFKSAQYSRNSDYSLLSRSFEDEDYSSNNDNNSNNNTNNNKINLDTDRLDINNIDHEAIRKDPDLRELSRNPSAFNNVPNNTSYYNRAPSNLQSQSDDEEVDDDDDVYKDVEFLVQNPLEERRQRRFVTQRSNQSFRSSVPISPKHKYNSFLSSSSCTAFENQENDSSMEKNIADSLNLQEDERFSFYLILKPIAFVLFMIFWILKEPIIRTISFITIIVSTLIVEPFFYLWSCLPDCCKKRMPDTSTRKKITHWCTATLIAMYLISTIKHCYPDQPFVPDWISTMTPNIQFNLPSFSWMPRWNIADRQEWTVTNDEFKILAERLNKVNDRFTAYTEKADKEYKTLTERLNKVDDQFTAYAKKVDSEYAKMHADSSSEYSELWTAIHNQQVQINALQDKLDNDLRELLSTKQYKLADSILLPLDKDKEAEIPAHFYEYLHNADSWNQFLKQNKVAIDKYLEGQMTYFFEKQEKYGAIISKETFLSLITDDLMKRSNNINSNDDPASTAPSLSQLIESAVEKYHQDVLDTADFALESRGGHIISSKTSPTYELLPPWKQHLFKSFGLSALTHPPELAIQPDTHAGKCWSMVGSSGTLGILLSEPIMIQSVTIEHPSKNILLQDIDSAPKDVEIYGVGNYGVNGQKEELVFLGRAYYDINNSNKPVQTFTINSNFTDAYRAVLVKIKTNWGNSDHTDIYRIRIHGVPL